MFGLPTSTEYNKRIPKQKFYENISVSPAMKRIFVEKIKSIYWRNKIATSTVNVAPGDIVTEIEVFEIKLQERNLDVSVLKQIDREIPYHIVFLLECDGVYQAWTSYKEPLVVGKNAFKVDYYYHTDWLCSDDLPLAIEGLSLDNVYEHFVRQIAGDALDRTDGESLKDSVEKNEEKKRIVAEIKKLEQKAWSEPQPKKKYDLYQKLKEKQSLLEELNHGES